VNRTNKLLSIEQREDRVIDSKTGEVMLVKVDFWTAHSVRSFQSLRDLKIWMNRNSCEPAGDMVNAKRFNQLETEFASLGVPQ
jgi:hypothetical protein